MLLSVDESDCAIAAAAETFPGRRTRVLQTDDSRSVSACARSAACASSSRRPEHMHRPLAMSPSATQRHAASQIRQSRDMNASPIVVRDIAALLGGQLRSDGSPCDIMREGQIAAKVAEHRQISHRPGEIDGVREVRSRHFGAVVAHAAAGGQAVAIRDPWSPSSRAAARASSARSRLAGVPVHAAKMPLSATARTQTAWQRRRRDTARR